ncbi:GntR family transcriptional regulator [Amycolatopsis pigmentata]|uniref:GntR family transcriptional regulator n=1 Tax=Amycolatopsis pigmentata TaxID=450801 RepID=A0ABW5FIP2_9PSEU
MTSRQPEGEVSNSASELAYKVLLGGIADGTYPPGTWVREPAVMAATGVSRTPVREALNRLQAEGVVELHRHRGALVIGWTAEDLDNLFDLRLALEGYGARRAAERGSAEQLKTLRKLCDVMEELLPSAGESELQRLGELCVEFHTELSRASGNRQLAAQLPRVLSPPFVSEAFHHHTLAELAKSFEHHRELVQALEARDSEWAEAVMRAHLRHGRQSLHRMEADRVWMLGESSSSGNNDAAVEPGLAE